ncbi:MAG: hypothetical protein NUW01_13225 [Gemmatimonadaceae bacterium]|nr:hypothetical protein [Gemmatimonadaceae bacterium]
MSVEQPKRVTVWWNDAHATKESIDHKDAVGKYHAPYPVATIGWLVKDDKEGVSIAHSWNPPNGKFEPWDYRDLHFFPRGTITKVEVLAVEVAKRRKK